MLKKSEIDMSNHSELQQIGTTVVLAKDIYDKYNSCFSFFKRNYGTGSRR